MERALNVNEWLPWLGRVRFLIITFLLAIVVAIRELTPIALPVGTLLFLAAMWYAVAIMCLLLNRGFPEARWQAPLQMALDLAVITGVVYVSGAWDSYFVSLYLLAILMASVLFSRRGTFLSASISFVLLALLAELSYYRVIPRVALSLPAARELESWLAINACAFLAVAYLGSLLAQAIRTKGIELREKSEELKNLQAFNQDIIESMRGGLLTAGLDGRIVLLNRAGAEIVGGAPGAWRGKGMADIFPGLWPVETDDKGNPLARRTEVELRTPEGCVRYVGLSVSLLRTGQNEASGYVLNFQDLTELKRLEREIVTKERMAALGRLSAAIAHEIRQPLTAMTGALKELARFAPLDDDDKRLVQIVSRESQRLNQIVSDFLDYAREKSYVFADVDVANAIEETLLLMERDVRVSRKYRIDRHIGTRNVRARADRGALKQILWNLCNNALRAMPEGGVLTAGLEADDSWVRVSIRDTGIGFDKKRGARIFEPFQSGFAGGTGLGLAIVYQIMQAHDGHIRVETAQGEGTEFVVELPRSRNATSAVEVSQPSDADIELLHTVGKG